MRELAIQEAGAALTSVIEEAAQGNPTVVTKDGRPVAVVVGFEAWEKLRGREMSFAELLASFPGDDEFCEYLESLRSPPRPVTR